MTTPLEIRVTLPATTSLLGFCRLAASAAAASLGFDVDELDDVRAAVGEAIGLLLSGHPIEAPTSALLELRLTLDNDSIEIAAEIEHPSLIACEETSLTAALLGATVDEYSFDLHVGRRAAHLVKHRMS